MLLIYELFSGVGFCNQLFSLETAIYLANITHRKLILLVRYPLCHCGRASWDYGHFLDYFSQDYHQFLPKGVQVYYKQIPAYITGEIKSAATIDINHHFSSNVFVDQRFQKPEFSEKVKNFAGTRKINYLNFEDITARVLYISKSNASRCFYNFFTTPEKYRIMNAICYSLTKYSKPITDLIERAKRSTGLEKGRYHGIHFRFGDRQKDSTFINQNNLTYQDRLESWIRSPNTDLPLVIMTDRRDNILLTQLAKQTRVIYVESLLGNTMSVKLGWTSLSTDVVQFLVEASILKDSQTFWGTRTSTVSNYLGYLRFLDTSHPIEKSVRYLSGPQLVEMDPSGLKFTWNILKIGGHPISWATFFPDNITV